MKSAHVASPGPLGLGDLKKGRALVIDYYSNAVSLLDLATGKSDTIALRHGEAPYANPTNAALASDGRSAWIVASGTDGHLLQFDLASRSIVHDIPIDGLSFGVAVVRARLCNAISSRRNDMKRMRSSLLPIAVFCTLLTSCAAAGDDGSAGGGTGTAASSVNGIVTDIGTGSAPGGVTIAAGATTATTNARANSRSPPPHRPTCPSPRPVMRRVTPRRRSWRQRMPC